MSRKSTMLLILALRCSHERHRSAGKRAQGGGTTRSGRCCCANFPSASFSTAHHARGGGSANDLKRLCRHASELDTLGRSSERPDASNAAGHRRYHHAPLSWSRLCRIWPGHPIQRLRSWSSLLVLAYAATLELPVSSRRATAARTPIPDGKCMTQCLVIVSIEKLRRARRESMHRSIVCGIHRERDGCFYCGWLRRQSGQHRDTSVGIAPRSIRSRFVDSSCCDVRVLEYSLSHGLTCHSVCDD